MNEFAPDRARRGAGTAHAGATTSSAASSAAPTTARTATPATAPATAPTRSGTAVRAAVCTAVLLAGCQTGGPAEDRRAMSPVMTAPSSAVGPAVGATPVIDLRGFRIETRVGEAFEIRLPGLPDSGHRWRLVDPVPAAVRAVGVARSASGPGDLAGTTAQESWRFVGADPGTGLLTFEFRRPTDASGDPPAQRAIYRVEVH